MTDFQQYIGVRYSGRKGPGDRVAQLRVFSAHGDHEPYPEGNPADENGHWSRRELAEWLADEGGRGGCGHRGHRPCILVPAELYGPQRAEELGRVPGRLRGPLAHGPLLRRELLPGNPRTGDPDEHRLTGRWTAFPHSVFDWDLQDSRARSTHAGLPWLEYVRRSGGRPGPRLAVRRIRRSGRALGTGRGAAAAVPPPAIRRTG